MNRQFKIHDETWGERTLFVIHVYEEGEWQEDWNIFRTDDQLKKISGLFSRVSYDAYQDALRGHCLPIIKELGPPPSACLLKTDPNFLRCALRNSCAMHDEKECLGDNKKDEGPPPCFEASVKNEMEESHHIRTLTSQVFELWRKGFYIIIAPASDFDIKE